MLTENHLTRDNPLTEPSVLLMTRQPVDLNMKNGSAVGLNSAHFLLLFLTERDTLAFIFNGFCKGTVLVTELEKS